MRAGGEILCSKCEEPKAPSELVVDHVKSDACEGCGKWCEDARKLHGHHSDYSKPLEVEWLCASCHGKKHRVPANA